MTRKLFGELLKDAADVLESQAVVLRLMRDRDGEQTGYQDARRLEAIARHIRANRLTRAAWFVAKTDTAVQDEMPAIVINMMDRDAHMRGQPCYCGGCAYWAIDFKHF